MAEPLTLQYFKNKLNEWNIKNFAPVKVKLGNSW